MLKKTISLFKTSFPFWCVVVLATAFSCNNSEVTPEPEVIYPLLLNSSITHDNEDRAYLLYIPEGYNESSEWPLVINFHGRGSSNQVQMSYSQFNTLADEHKFMVAYPQGLVGTVGGVTATHWNSNFRTGIDDTGFVNVMIDEIYANQGLDLTKVYAIGMSNGGFMAYTLACDMSDRIAAIASVTGGMSANSLDICSPLRPVPIIEFHGTADEVVPYWGLDGLPPTVPDVVDFWVSNNQCNASEVIEEELPDTNIDDNSTVSLQQYNSCNQATNVVFYTINNGGHTWPGAFPVASLGSTNQDINASGLIWEFLNSHNHPNPKMPGS
ncbi:MAG: hypothetical protein L3J29_02705 [Cyclobacteriaceae bacterium]|nr:hypothetical protein [Cyclobacteriaceae bacterium]